MLTREEEKQGEQNKGVSEYSRFKSLADPFRLIVFPFRVFREITHSKSPLSVLPGFLLVIALQTATQASIIWLRASKIFLDSGAESVSLLGSDLFGTSLLASLLQNSLGFILSWITYAIIMFLIARFFSQKKDFPMNSFLVIFGYVFSVLVIYGVITALLVSFLPEIHFEASVWYSGTPEDLVIINDVYNAVWGSLLVFRAMDYLGLVFMFWVVGLGALLVNVSHEIKLMTAIVLSFTAYFASILMTAFLSALL